MKKNMLMKMSLFILVMAMCTGCGKTQQEETVEENIQIDTDTIIKSMKEIPDMLEGRENVTITNTSEDGMMVTAVYQKPVEENTEEPLSADGNDSLVATYTGSTVPVGSLKDNDEFKSIKLDSKECYYKTNEEETTVMLLEDTGNETYTVINITINNPDISVKEACKTFIL